MPADTQTTSILAWIMANAMIPLLVCAILIGLSALFISMRTSARTARILRRIDRLGRQLDDQHVHMSKTRDLMNRLETNMLNVAPRTQYDGDPDAFGFAPLDEAEATIEEASDLDANAQHLETIYTPEPQSEPEPEPEPEFEPEPASDVMPERTEAPGLSAEKPSAAVEEASPPPAAPSKSLFRDAVSPPDTPSSDQPASEPSAKGASGESGDANRDESLPKTRNDTQGGLVFRDIFGAPTPRKTLPPSSSAREAAPAAETAAPPTPAPKATSGEHAEDSAAQDADATVIPMPSSDAADEAEDASNDRDTDDGGFSIPEFLKPRASSTQAPKEALETRYPDPSETPPRESAATPAAEEDEDDFHIPEFLKTGGLTSTPEFGRQPPPPPAPAARSAQQPATQNAHKPWIASSDSKSTENIPESAPPAPTRTPVDCSFYSPIDVEKKTAFIVQAIFHNAQHASQADAAAHDIDPETARRVSKTLREDIAEGQKITVSLEIDGADVEDPVQTFTWRNKIEPIQFSATFPETAANGGMLAKARISVDGLPLGSAIWRITVTPTQALLTPASLQPHLEPPKQSIEVKPYARAFISYSSKDRVEVLKRVQALRAAGLEVFQDLLDLEPGERWEKALYTHITECDVFFLFWSPNASQSEWVAKEWRYALDISQLNAEHRPDICPVILTAPPPLPPAELSDRHFNDMIAYVLAAEEAQKASHKA